MEKKDDEVDFFRTTGQKKNVTNKIKDPNFNRDLIIPYILLARDIERIADHATNLCEEIVYIEKRKNN